MLHIAFFELNHKCSNDFIQIYVHFIANKYVKLVSIQRIFHTFINGRTGAIGDAMPIYMCIDVSCFVYLGFMQVEF